MDLHLLSSMNVYKALFLGQSVFTGESGDFRISQGQMGL